MSYSVNIFSDYNLPLTATSLCEAEAKEKFVGVLSVKGKQFMMEEFKLKTVRPMIFKTISLIEDGPDLSKAKDEKTIQAKVDKFLKDYIEKLLVEGMMN